MLRGWCWELTMSVLLTNETEYGFLLPTGKKPLHLFPTPTCCQAPNTGSKTRGPKSLVAVAQTNWTPGEMWLTPTASEGLRVAFGQEANKKHWEKHPRSTLSEQVAVRDYERGIKWSDGGRLNPDWVEWLMGWPIGWSDLQPLETDKYRSWLQQHSAC